MSIVVDRCEGVLTLTIDCPARKNALDYGAFVRLGEELAAADADPEVRVVVVTGAGGNFCSGADLTGFIGDTHPLVRMEQINRAAQALHRVHVPTIAKVDGVAVGAGLNLALGCDIVVATDRARFSEIFSKRGLSVDFGGSWILPRLVGLHRAKELCFLADVLSAAEAAELGLVNRVVPADELDKTVDVLAARLAAGPPIALALTKRMLNESSVNSFDQALDQEAQSQAVNLMGADAAEAFAAFLAKREPIFTGGTNQ